MRRFWRLISGGELQMIAAALSFSTVLSIIPFFAVTLAAIQSLYGLDALYPKIETAVLHYFQGPAGQNGMLIIHKVFRRVQNGRMGSWGAMALILSSLMLVNEMEKAFHRIWALPKRRPLIERLFFYCLFLFTFPLLLTIFVTFGSMKLIEDISIPGFIPSLQVAALVLTLFITYKAVPNTKVQSGLAFIFSSGAAVGLIVVTKSFKWFSQTFFSWGKLYGSLAAIPTLLLWILLIWYIILIGAALTASYNHSRNNQP